MKIDNWKLKIIKLTIYASIFLASLGLVNGAHAAITIRPMLNTGLVGYWSMEEGMGTKVGDMSGNGNNGDITGASWTDGKRGKALDFDGSNDYVDAADGGRLNLVDGDFTVGAWAKSRTFDTAGLWQRIVYKGETSTKGYSISVTNSIAGGAHFVFGIRDASGTYYKAWSNGGKVLNKWYHIVAVYKSGTLDVYVDGVLDTGADRGGTPTINTATNLQIGQRGDNLRRFDGLIDEVRVYNRALSAAEVANLYTSSKMITKIKAPSNTGLVGYWSMEEGMGTKVGDMSGNGNNGDITGASWTDGKRGKALSFNGSSGSVIAADTNNTLDAANAVTISTWFYPNTLNSGWRVLVSKDGGSNSNYWLGTNNSKFALTFRTNGTGAWNNHYTNNDYTPGQWYHVVGIIDSANNNMRMYINNVLDIDSQSETDNMSANNSSLYIGYDNGNNTWINGIIDEVRIYNRALSATEVASLYNASKKITKVNTSQNNKLTDGLVGLWSFNGPDISGTTAFDRSGQNNHGAITGAVPAIGKVGQALSFNGTSDYVNVGPLNWGGWGATTISLWWYARTFPEETRLIHKNDDTSGSGSHYFMLSNYSAAPVNALRARFNINSTVNTLNSDANYTETGKWIHTVVVYNGSQVIYYKDGTQFGAADSLSGTLTADNTAVTGIGAGPTDIYMPFNGLIDEVRIYNRALSASEIKRLYNMGR